MDVRFYLMKDIIHENVTGDIDLEKAKALVRKLAAAAAAHPGRNILVDLRATTLSLGSMADAMAITLEFMNELSRFENKIAVIVPNDKERISLASLLEACLVMKAYRYKVFTVFEEALDWLSERETLEDV